jgi:hypothetical protein
MFVGSHLTSRGEGPSALMVSDWLTLSFTGLPHFTDISVVYQGFSDKSDGIPVARVPIAVPKKCGLRLSFSVPTLECTEQHSHTVTRV